MLLGLRLTTTGSWVASCIFLLLWLITMLLEGALSSLGFGCLWVVTITGIWFMSFSHDTELDIDMLPSYCGIFWSSSSLIVGGVLLRQPPSNSFPGWTQPVEQICCVLASWNAAPQCAELVNARRRVVCSGICTGHSSGDSHTLQM